MVCGRRQINKRFRCVFGSCADNTHVAQGNGFPLFTVKPVAASLSGGPTASADNGRGLWPWLRSGRRTGSLAWMGWIMLLSDCQSGVVRGKQRKEWFGKVGAVALLFKTLF